MYETTCALAAAVCSVAGSLMNVLTEEAKLAMHDLTAPPYLTLMYTARGFVEAIVGSKAHVWERVCARSLTTRAGLSSIDKLMMNRAYPTGFS